jgi:hypothetical protein
MKFRVSWDIRWCSTGSIGKLGWDGDLSGSSDLHVVKSELPSLDDLSCSESELEWFSFGVAIEGLGD